MKPTAIASSLAVAAVIAGLQATVLLVAVARPLGSALHAGASGSAHATARAGPAPRPAFVESIVVGS